MTKKVIIFFLFFIICWHPLGMAKYQTNDHYTYKGNFQRSGSSSMMLSEQAIFIGAFSLGHNLDTFYALSSYLLINNHEKKLLRFHPETQRTSWISRYSYAQVSHPTLWDNRLYFGTLNGRLVCLDWQSGLELWNQPVFARVSSAPLVVDGKAIFGTSDGWIYALNKDNGSIVWSFDAGSSLVADLATDNEVIVAATVAGRVIITDLHGQLIWDTFIEGSVTQSPAIEDGALIVATYEGALYCINNHGTVRWHKLNHPFLTSSPIIQRGKVYQFFADGYLRSYSILTGDLELSVYLETPRQTPLMSGHSILFRLWNGVLALNVQTQQSKNIIFQEGFDTQAMVLIGNKLYLLMKTGEIFSYSL